MNVPKSIRYILAGAIAAAVVAGIGMAVAASTTQTTQPLLPNGKDPSVYQQKPDWAQQIPAAPRTPKPIAPAPPEGGPARGIVESSQGPFPGGLYAIQNQWQDEVGFRWVQVYAGSLYSDPQQGILVVRISSLDWSQSTVAGVYLAGHSGSLKIVAASGSILTVQSLSGVVSRFDASTQRFV